MISIFGSSTLGHTSIDRIATVQGGNVTLQAARDLLAAGAQVQASADLQGLAGRNLSVSAVQTSDSLALKFSPQQINAGGLNGTGSYAQSASTAQFGSQLSAEGKATLIAGAALDLKASQVSAGNTLGLPSSTVHARKCLISLNSRFKAQTTNAGSEWLLGLARLASVRTAATFVRR